MNMPDAGLALCILFTALMLYDLWLVRFKGTGSSVSNFLLRAGFKSPVIVGGIMFLAGHLFGGMFLEADPKWYTPGYNIAFSIYLLAGGLLCFAGARVCLKVGENKELAKAQQGLLEATRIIQDARDVARGTGPMFPKLGQRGEAWLNVYGVEQNWLGMEIKLNPLLPEGTAYLENQNGERVWIKPEEKNDV